MKMNIKLSESSIENAISRLEEAQEDIEQLAGDLVDILVTDGEIIANEAYGEMATAWGQRDSENEGVAKGHIGVSGEDDDVVYIAEFGAGDATMPVEFENQPPVDVYAGSYSESPKGAGEYATMGYWEFPPKSGNYMTEVSPRHGLLNAKRHIVENGADIARELLRS